MCGVPCACVCRVCVFVEMYFEAYICVYDVMLCCIMCFFLSTGTGKGGDCDHLLLASSPTKYIEVRAHGGEILIEDTHVESWDIVAGTVDENDEDGRRCALAWLGCLGVEFIVLLFSI